MASALDIVSQGRFELGLGAGWNELESGAYGIELGTLKKALIASMKHSLSSLLFLVKRRRLFQESTTHSKVQEMNPRASTTATHLYWWNWRKRTLRSVAHHATHWNLPVFEDQLFKQNMKF